MNTTRQVEMKLNDKLIADIRLPKVTPPPPED